MPDDAIVVRAHRALEDVRIADGLSTMEILVALVGAVVLWMLFKKRNGGQGQTRTQVVSRDVV